MDKTLRERYAGRRNQIKKAMEARMIRNAKPNDATWLAIRARLTWVELMVGWGVSRNDAFDADQRLQLVKRLPSASRVRECQRVARWLLKRMAR